MIIGPQPGFKDSSLIEQIFRSKRSLTPTLASERQMSAAETLSTGNASLRIFLNITHGFQARMLLRSKITEELLARGASLVVCSLNAEESYFANEFRHPQITLVQMPTRTSRWEARLMNWRQYLLMNPS
ncbi:MAG: hypothetical protein ACK6CE_16760, partial [Planctomycetota bacterium]